MAAWLLLLIAPSTGFAQGSKVSIQGLNDLTFPAVVAGSTAQVLFSDPGAAKFTVDLQRGGKVLITFTLPTNLLANGTPLSITFGPNAAAWAWTDQASSATTFDPVQGTSLSLAGNRTAYVWLGGRVSPPVNQVAGTYSGSITVTVAYY